MPSLDVDDTIAAIATAAGQGLRGIIRISGPNCLACLNQAFSFSTSNPISKLVSPMPLGVEMILEQDLKIPGTLIIWPTNRSYTRQPSAEFHTFGSEPILQLALTRICQSGARLANPGEFTLRAFLSGRLDLTQAEAVLGIIDAQAPTELDGALKQLAGGLSGPLIEAREQLIYVLAELEAGLDFAEEDIAFISRDVLLERLVQVQSTMTGIIDQIECRALATEPTRVALIGLPNAGKSCLFNELLGAQKAIVSQLAGTTTDFLIGKLEIEGLIVELTDTAGFESTADLTSISGIAQQQREFAESNSQLQLLCLDGSIPRTAWECERIAAAPATTIIVETKSDLPPAKLSTIDPELIQRWKAEQRWVSTSSADAASLGMLRRTIRNRVLEHSETKSEIVGTTIMRTAKSLRSAANCIKSAQLAVSEQAGEEIIAAEIRAALDDVGLVVGTVYTDNILDVVFGRFCIGK